MSLPVSASVSLSVSVSVSRPQLELLPLLPPRLRSLSALLAQLFGGSGGRALWPPRRPRPGRRSPAGGPQRRPMRPSQSGWPAGWRRHRASPARPAPSRRRARGAAALRDAGATRARAASGAAPRARPAGRPLAARVGMRAFACVDWARGSKTMQLLLVHRELRASCASASERAPN